MKHTKSFYDIACLKLFTPITISQLIHSIFQLLVRITEWFLYRSIHITSISCSYRCFFYLFLFSFVNWLSSGLNFCINATRLLWHRWLSSFDLMWCDIWIIYITIEIFILYSLKKLFLSMLSPDGSILNTKLFLIKCLLIHIKCLYSIRWILLLL